MKELREMSEIEFLQTHGAVITELMNRGVVSTRNNPIGDYTEWLVRGRLRLNEAEKNQKGFDAISTDGTRYQIKGRSDEATSVQLGAIRNLDDDAFDYVIAVVFNHSYSIRFAAAIPHEIVRRFATYQEHTNAHNLSLTDKITQVVGVINLQHRLD